MAFWGIELKPGKPFTHIADDAKGRLHISQATLGIGTATKKSIVQCNVGDKSPVFLCSLFAEKAESCQLNLEFEEADEVVFSVIGPRSVHLTGYFVGRGAIHYNLNDESESYGEDIADTETERSTGYSDEDKYEDSFINDDNPEVFPSSPVSSSEEIEETLEKRTKSVKGSHRRLRKKYQLSDSDDDVDAQEHMVANGTSVQDSETEDMLPISTLCKFNPSTMGEKLEAKVEVVEKSGDINPSTWNGKVEAEETADKKISATRNDDAKDEGHCSSISGRAVDFAFNVEPKRRPNLDDSKLPSLEMGLENTAKPKKKKKTQPKDSKDFDTDGANSSNVLKKDKAPQNDTQSDKVVPHIPLNEENPKTFNHDTKSADVPPDFLLPSAQVGSESDVKPKKRKIKERAEEKKFEYGSDHTNLYRDGSSLQDEVKPDSMGQDFLVRNEQNERESTDKNFYNNIQSVGENQSVEKKKKSKKRKTIEDEKVIDIELALLSMDAKSGSVMDTEKLSGNSKLSQLRTLPGGVVIEELEAGKPDGKVAALGKKISVRYTGKLKENGQIFDSTLDGAPFKFRLGSKEIIDGFDVGLEGMRVGEKRRIFIPPLMGYGSEGDGENVPPNSSLVYDVKLVKVHR